MKSMLEQRKIFRKKLIQRETFSEKILYDFFKTKNIFFERQKIISPYIADFLILDRGLIIELDGSVHQIDKIKEKDYRRDDYFMSMGFFVLHFPNNTIHQDILNKINQFSILPKERIKRIKSYISKVNGMAHNKIFSKVMMDFSDYHQMRELWKKFKSGTIQKTW